MERVPCGFRPAGVIIQFDRAVYRRGGQAQHGYPRVAYNACQSLYPAARHGHGGGEPAESPEQFTQCSRYISQVLYECVQEAARQEKALRREFAITKEERGICPFRDVKIRCEKAAPAR